MKTALLLVAVLVAGGCRGAGESDARAFAATLTGGDPVRGRTLVHRYGCHTCHTIPGIRDANASVGPPLDRVGVRTYVLNRPNQPETMVQILRDPRSVDPSSAMPDTGVDERDGRDLAAFLYTLR